MKGSVVTPKTAWAGSRVGRQGLEWATVRVRMPETDRYGIDSEYDVGELDADESEEQRGSECLGAVFALREEPIAVVQVSRGQESMHARVNRVGGDALTRRR